LVVGVERREHDHLRRVVAAAQRLGGGEAVDAGHADVHQHDVGPVGVDRRVDLRAVGRLGHHADVLAAREHH
jgi:hypothetical protein